MTTDHPREKLLEWEEPVLVLQEGEEPVLVLLEGEEPVCVLYVCDVQQCVNCGHSVCPVSEETRPAQPPLTHTQQKQA